MIICVNEILNMLNKNTVNNKLISACRNNDISKIKKLINNPKCNFNYIASSTNALIEVCKNGNIEILDLFIKNNDKICMNFNIKILNWTPIMYAVANYKLDIVKKLIDNINVTNININYINKNNQSIYNINTKNSIKIDIKKKLEMDRYIYNLRNK